MPLLYVFNIVGNRFNLRVPSNQVLYGHLILGVYTTLNDDVYHTIFAAVDTICIVVAIDKGHIQRRESCSLSEGFTRARQEMKGNVGLGKRNIYLWMVSGGSIRDTCWQAAEFTDNRHCRSHLFLTMNMTEIGTVGCSGEYLWKYIYTCLLVCHWRNSHRTV